MLENANIYYNNIVSKQWVHWLTQGSQKKTWGLVTIHTRVEGPVSKHLIVQGRLDWKNQTTEHYKAGSRTPQRCKTEGGAPIAL